MVCLAATACHAPWRACPALLPIIPRASLSIVQAPHMLEPLHTPLHPLQAPHVLMALVYVMQAPQVLMRHDAPMVSFPSCPLPACRVLSPPVVSSHRLSCPLPARHVLPVMSSRQVLMCHDAPCPLRPPFRGGDRQHTMRHECKAHERWHASACGAHRAHESMARVWPKPSHVA